MAAMGGGESVLVVDDDDSLRLLCRVNLELDGYRVFEAASLGEARRLLAEHSVDVILLDCRLGDGDGRELLRELRSTGDRPPVALFTGSEVVEASDRSLAAGVIPKPFALEDLAATVASLSGRAGR